MSQEKTEKNVENAESILDASIVRGIRNKKAAKMMFYLLAVLSGMWAVLVFVMTDTVTFAMFMSFSNMFLITGVWLFGVDETLRLSVDVLDAFHARETEKNEGM